MSKLEIMTCVFRNQDFGCAASWKIKSLENATSPGDIFFYEEDCVIFVLSVSRENIIKYILIEKEER